MTTELKAILLLFQLQIPFFEVYLHKYLSLKEYKPRLIQNKLLVLYGQTQLRCKE